MEDLLARDDIIHQRSEAFGQFNQDRQAVKNRLQTHNLEAEVLQIKRDAISKLAELISQTLEQMTVNGIHAEYAKTAADARNIVLKIVKNNNAIVQSSTDLPVEIDLDQALAKQGITLSTTETYCRLFQLAEDAVGTHKGVPMRYATKEDWARILNPLNKRSPQYSPESSLSTEEINPSSVSQQLISHIQSMIQQTPIGLTGANAISAADGACIITHSLGNVNLVAQRPTHIVLVGIDKIVPTLIDAWKTTYLESLYSSGLGGPTYQLMIRGPSWPTKVGDVLTPIHLTTENVHVVLVDNGRTQIIQDGFSELLYCIRCFTCHNHCPSYIALGPGKGFDFRTPGFGYKGYLGGRGTALAHYLFGAETGVKSGLYKCTLCGACYRECPMEINIPQIIQKLRHTLL